MLLAALGPGVHSTSNRNEFQKQKNHVSEEKVLSVCRVDNLADVCEPIV
jgi:hypothetical protein